MIFVTVLEVFFLLTSLLHTILLPVATAKPLFTPLALASYRLNDFTGTSNTLFQYCDDLTVTSKYASTISSFQLEVLKPEKFIVLSSCIIILYCTENGGQSLRP